MPEWGHAWFFSHKCIQDVKSFMSVLDTGILESGEE